MRKHEEFETIKILMVEDNPDDAELAKRVFKKQNIANHVEWVKDGPEALDFLLGKGDYEGQDMGILPKVILLDIKLPKMDGTQVLEEVKRNPELKHIPIVVLTSSYEEQDLIKSYELGANSYIVKPVDFDQFQQVVEELGLYWGIMNKTGPLHTNKRKNKRNDHQT